MKHVFTALVWQYVEDEMPDEETTVLVATTDKEVTEAFLDEGVWKTTAHAVPIESLQRLAGQQPAPVYAWAHLPEAPELRATRT